MRRADLVDVDSYLRIFFYQRAGSSRVVEVNVRQQNCIEVAHANAARSQLPPQRFQGRSGAGIDNRTVAVRFQQGRGDRAPLPHPVVVECGDRVHESPRN